MYNVCIRSTDFRFGVTGTKCRRGFRTSFLTPLFNVLIVWGWPIKISPKMSQIPKPKHIALFPSTCTNVHTFRINNPKKKKKSVAAAKIPGPRHTHTQENITHLLHTTEFGLHTNGQLPSSLNLVGWFSNCPKQPKIEAVNHLCTYLLIYHGYTHSLITS